MIESLTGGSAQAMIRVGASLSVFLILVFVEGPWQLGLAMLVALPSMITVMTVIMLAIAGDEIKASKGQDNTSVKAVAEKSAGKVLGEVVMSIRTVTSFNAQERFYREYEASVDRVVKLDKAGGWKTAFATSISMPLFLAIFGGMYFYIGYLVRASGSAPQPLLLPPRGRERRIPQH